MHLPPSLDLNIVTSAVARRRLARLSAGFGIGLLWGASASAQLTWNNAGPSDQWSTSAANWSGNSAWVQNSSAIFGSAGETVTVTTANVFNDLTFNVSGYNIADGAGSLTLANDRASTVTVGLGLTAMIAESLADNGAGASALTKAGSGILTLTNTASSFSGGFTISAGAVIAGATGASGAGTLGTGAVSVGSGAILALNSASGGATYTNAFSGAGNLLVGTGSGSGTTIFNGDMSGYTGAMTISGGGKALFWNLGGGGPASSATIDVSANATIYVFGAITVGSAVTLNGGATGESLGQLRVENGATYSGNVTLAGNITGDFNSFIGTHFNTGTFSGVISETGGSRTLSKSGSATSILTGTNTYTGGTSIFSGTLQVGNGGTTGALGSGAISTSGTLAFNRSDTVTLGSAIGGSGGLNQLGSGTLRLTAASTYTGPTVVSAGTLEISGSISEVLSVSVAGGALTLSAVNAVNSTSTALTLGDGGGGTSGTLNLVGSNLTETFGALSVRHASTIDFGTGSGGQDLLFSSVGTLTAGATLTISNWSGLPYTLGSTATDRLLFTGSASDFTSAYPQSSVTFAGYGTGYQALPSSGGYEIVAIPEGSSTALLGGFGLLTLAFRHRHRRTFPR